MTNLLARAADWRATLVTQDHRSAFRVFNGFYEGCPQLLADIFAKTLLLTYFGKDPQPVGGLIDQAVDQITSRFNWINCVIVKHHHHVQPEYKRGILLTGSQPAQWIEEHEVRYALNLRINQDAGFYLDTRHLRKWIRENSCGLQVLNTFAYTGSLGVAALAGGASQVLQMDLNRKFLEMSRDSVSQNGISHTRNKLLVEDFFVGVARLKRSGHLFDLVFLDPPFFSVTEKGRVDQARESHRLINKVRPLVKDGGKIVAVNNSLFLEGKAYLAVLQDLVQDGYLSLEEIIPVPEDITGFPATILAKPPRDPAPFNHPTKIVVLKVKRKSLQD